MSDEGHAERASEVVALVYVISVLFRPSVSRPEFLPYAKEVAYPESMGQPASA